MTYLNSHKWYCAVNYFCSFLISLGCIYSIRTSGSSSVHSHVPRTLIVMGAQTSSCHLLPKTAAINNLHTRQEGRVTISFVYTPKQDCWVIRTSCCCCSVAKPILNPPPTSLPIPSLWVIPGHQPQASCILHQTWTGDSFLIWYYTCFNAILPNHPHPPQSPKDCSIHLCLFCCLAYIFLNSIYMR